MSGRPYAADDFDAIRAAMSKLKLGNISNQYDWWVYKDPRQKHYNLFPLSEKAKKFLGTATSRGSNWITYSPVDYTDSDGSKISWGRGVKNEDWVYDPEIHDTFPPEQ